MLVPVPPRGSQQHPVVYEDTTTQIIVSPADMIFKTGITDKNVLGRRQIIPPMQPELTTKGGVRKISPL